jgi:hypothetical protein
MTKSHMHGHKAAGRMAENNGTVDAKLAAKHRHVVSDLLNSAGLQTAEIVCCVQVLCAARLPGILARSNV